jgi:hypothetical protein
MTTPPHAAALRKFEPPLIAADYAGELMASKRTAGGTILGTSVKRYVNEQHVPHLDEDTRSRMHPSKVCDDTSAVGPENPVVPYNSNVSQCWDDEAGAVYYYNHSSGEASWLPPEA